MTEARERILNSNRFGGVLTVWKGKWGFIEPSTNIKHPEAEKNQGRVFVHANDLDPEVKLKKGCSLSFVLYTDGKGLGAEEVKLSKKQPQAPASPAKGAGKTMPKPKAAVKGSGKKGQEQPVRKVIQTTFQKKGSGKGGKAAGKNGKGAAPIKSTVGDTIDRSNRVRLSKGRLSGTIVKLKGVIGWIKPDSKIPNATKDTLFLHKTDFKGQGQPLGMGCKVDFFVYQDESGIGAEHCRHLPGAKQPNLSTMQKKAPPVAGKTVIKTFTKQQLQAKKGGGKGAAGKGQVMVKGKGKGAKGGAVKVQKPRKRVVNFRITGEVLDWKGKFGWIAPVDGIDHPEASKHEGKIFVSMADVKGGKGKLNVGQTVEFFCYADGNGLGAEQVKVV